MYSIRIRTTYDLDFEVFTEDNEEFIQKDLKRNLIRVLSTEDLPIGTVVETRPFDELDWFRATVENMGWTYVRLEAQGTGKTIDRIRRCRDRRSARLLLLNKQNTLQNTTEKSNTNGRRFPQDIIGPTSDMLASNNGVI